MPRIFLSYRRADSAAIAGRIFDRLLARYGTGSVFMDIDEIPFGTDFRTHVARVLADCDAVVVVIGPAWLGLRDSGSRLDDPADPVRVEVQGALARDIPLVPVLVGGATMPAESGLPETLRPLAYRNACEIDTGRDFHPHVDRLIRSLDRSLGLDVPVSELAARPGPPAEIAATPAGAAVPSGDAPWPAGKVALFASLLALPQVVQFSGRVPLFVLALFVSAIGTAICTDEPHRSLGLRAGTAALVLAVAFLVQGGLGVLRASTLAW